MNRSFGGLTSTVGWPAIIEHFPAYTSKIWYVKTAADGGDDTHSGKEPDAAFATIGQAISSASAGDAITVKTGTYTANVDVNKTGLELWGEIGATIVGTLTVSANSCGVRGLVITPVAAVGLALTGSFCVIEGVQIKGTPTIAMDIDGSDNVVNNCNAIGYTVTAFDISAPRVHLYRCVAHGADTATRGFYLSNAAADINYLEECSSLGNTTAGYELVTGVANCALVRCASGSDDGRWLDTDYASTWPDFNFDNLIRKSITLDGSGTYNLFQVTGEVQINHIYGIVTTALPAATTAASLQLFPAGGAAIQLTSLAGSDISSLPVGSMINKAATAATAISVSNSTLGFLSEQTGLLLAIFAVGQKTGGIATYVRLNVTEVGTSGAIDWYCDWQPLSNDGFLAPV